MADHMFRPNFNGPCLFSGQASSAWSVPGTCKWPQLRVPCGSQSFLLKQDQESSRMRRGPEGTPRCRPPAVAAHWLGHQGLAHLSRTHSRASPLGSRAIQNLCCSVVLQRAFKGQAEVPLARRYLLTLTLDIVTLYKSGRIQGRLDNPRWQPQPKTLGHQVPALQHSIQLQD